MESGTPHRKSAALLIALAFLGLVQVVWTLLASPWLGHMPMTTPKGYYAGISSNSWYSMHLGSSWPVGDGPPGGVIQFRAGGITFSRFPTYITIFTLRVEWTIGLTVLLCLVQLRVLWRDFRRNPRTANLNTCRKCGYDLRASLERCPECGLVVSEAQKRLRGTPLVELLRPTV